MPDGAEEDGPAGEDLAERELRFLLERAVPRTAAPEGRMEQIRRRVLRRRRRRAAVVATACAVAVVAGLSGTLRLPDAGSSGVVTGPPAASATAGTVVRYPGFPGLAVTLPQGWYAYSGPGPSGRATGFAGTAPGRVPDLDCPEVTAGGGRCAEPAPLRPGDVLIVFSAASAGGTEEEVRRPGSAAGLDMDTYCRKLSGVREASRPAPSVPVESSAPGGASRRAGTSVIASVCAREAPERVLAEAAGVLESLATAPEGEPSTAPSAPEGDRSATSPAPAD